MKIFKKKKRIVFEAARQEEGTEYLANPSCGWYEIYSYALEEELDFEKMIWSLNEGETIVLLLIDIGAFKKEPLSGEALFRLSRLLSFFRDHGKEIIFRAVYDREGRGADREPEFSSQVETHMGQLGEVLKEFADNILVVQGILVGNWGEMHGSKFLSPQKVRKLVLTYRKALGDRIPLAVRKPAHWRQVFNKKEDPGAMLTGIFDDGMFGSDRNLGTYGVTDRRDAEWGESWSKEDELSFIRVLSERVPYGGEAVGTDAAGDPEKAIRELDRAGAVYLNCKHDEERLALWKRQMTPRGVVNGKWKNVSCYDYIGCHLGYRFVVRDVSFLEEKTPRLSLTVENTGFSGMKEAMELLFLVKEAGQQKCREFFRLYVPERAWKSGECKEVAAYCEGITEFSQAELYVKLVRARDKAGIRFANRNTGDEDGTGSDRFCHYLGRWV